MTQFLFEGGKQRWVNVFHLRHFGYEDGDGKSVRNNDTNLPEYVLSYCNK
jgi:hypothetical protein